MKIVFTDYYYPDNEIERKILSQLDDVEIIDCTLLQQGGIKDAKQLIPYVRDADAVIVQFADISKEVIEAMDQCKIIVRYAIGVDNINVKVAKSKGITVSNVPDYCIEEVSDTAMAHMLNLCRAISYSNTLVRSNSFLLEKVRPLQRLSESTIGFVAFGNIARRTAEKMRGFSKHILAYDPFFKNQKEFDWVTFVSLEELLTTSDIISIHAPLTESTRHLIGEKEFNLMKDGVYIVNTSRGGLIDEKAMIKALKSGKMGGVGLDVLDTFDTNYSQSPLLHEKGNVVISPHLGWYSETSIREMKIKVANNVVAKMTNDKAIYEI